MEYGIDMGDYLVGSFSNKDNVVHWLSKNFDDELAKHKMSDWRISCTEMSFDEWID